MMTATTPDAYPYPSGHATYRLLRDGHELLIGTEQECWAYLHRYSSASVAWALRYEGYRMEPIDRV